MNERAHPWIKQISMDNAILSMDGVQQQWDITEWDPDKSFVLTEISTSYFLTDALLYSTVQNT